MMFTCKYYSNFVSQILFLLIFSSLTNDNGMLRSSCVCTQTSFNFDFCRFLGKNDKEGREKFSIFEYLGNFPDFFRGSRRPPWVSLLFWLKRKKGRKEGKKDTCGNVSENDNVDSSSILYRRIGARFRYAKFLRELQVFELILELERIVNSFHLISLSCYIALLNQGCAWRTNVRWKSEYSRILTVNFHDDFKDEISNNFFFYSKYVYISLQKFYKNTVIG